MSHPSPGSSFRLEPLIAELAPTRQIWAVDTPGYGMSDPLEAPEPTVGDYAAALAETIEAAGLDSTDLYGSHTGAKIVLELAVRHPGRVRRLVLDGLGLYRPEERSELLERYAPPITPDPHGTHLLRYWGMQRDMHLFWPWYRRSAEARLDRNLPPPERLHELVVDFLLAGADYWKGYRAAFSHDTEHALERLSVPTLVIASSRDPLQAHLDRFEASATVTVETPGAGDDPIVDLGRRIVRFLDG